MPSPDRLRPLCVLLFLALSSVPLAPSSCRGADFDPDREARRIFTTVMSPYCPGLTLADCGSSGAAVLRDSIRAQLRRGRPPEEILDELVAIFGPNVLALPPNGGVGRLAWLGPIATLLVGLGFLFWWMRRRYSAQPSPPPAGGEAAGIDPALHEKLREELQKFE